MDKVIYRSNGELKSKSNPVVLNSIFGNIFVKIILFAVSTFLFYNVYHSVLITSEKIQISKNAVQEVDNLRLENLKLELKLESMKTSAYLEIQARDRLNFSEESEYIFVIPEEVMNTAKESIDTYLYATNEKEKNTVYAVWLDFFYDGI